MLHMKPIELNNRGVKQLEAGDFGGAKNIFGVAISLLKLLQPAKMNSSKPSGDTTYEWSAEAPITARQDWGSIYVYSRGMYIHPTSSSTSPTNKETRLNAEDLAVIMFNAALASHLNALETSESAHLKRAQALYRVSRSILGKRHVAGARSRLCHRHYFHVALLNNLGQLSFELVEFEAGKTYFDQLYRNMRLIMSRNKRDRVYSQSDLKGMMANALVEAPTTAPSA